MAIDINPLACQVSRDTASCNQVLLDTMNGDLVKGFRCRGKIDILLFNPPYVVTEPREVGSNGIEAAWAGGIDGRQVIDQFMPSIQSLLSPKGVFYLVVIRENRPMELIEWMQQFGLHGKIVKFRKAGYEGLHILRFSFVEY